MPAIMVVITWKIKHMTPSYQDGGFVYRKSSFPNLMTQDQLVHQLDALFAFKCIICHHLVHFPSSLQICIMDTATIPYTSCQLGFMLKMYDFGSWLASIFK